jgi:hypothetical protein
MFKTTMIETFYLKNKIKNVFYVKKNIINLKSVLYEYFYILKQLTLWPWLPS